MVVHVVGQPSSSLSQLQLIAQGWSEFQSFVRINKTLLIRSNHIKYIIKHIDFKMTL